MVNGTSIYVEPVDRNHTIEPDVSIILVCWNNKDYLDPCLRSLYDGNLQHTFNIIVVDNGSTDNSQAMLREKYPDVILIQNDRNVGLSRASNQGIQATQSRMVLLLNNDTIVNGPSLDALIDFMEEKPDAGAVGGLLLNPDGSFQSGYAGYSSLVEELLIVTGIGILFWEGYPSQGKSMDVRQVGWLSSACLLLRRSALDQVGLLDEEYFIYGDEADLQYRLNKAGWKIYYLPSSTTIHFGGRSMDRWRRRKMVYRGKLLFYKKNYGPFKTAILRVMFVILSLIKMLWWSISYLFPSVRQRARPELQSNKDIIKLCWRME